MRYIQLNTRAIPDTAEISVCFPFLREDGEDYRFALLASADNQALCAALVTLGFELDDSTDPGAAPAGRWQFYVCARPTGAMPRRGLLAPLSSASGTPPERALATYITWTLPAGTVVTPTALTIEQSTLHPDVHNDQAGIDFQVLEFDEVANRSWKLANSDGTDAVAISAELPISGRVPGSRPVAATWNLVPLPDTTTWGGCQLHLEDVPIEGGPNDYLVVGDYAFRTHSPDGVQVSLSLEARLRGFDVDLFNNKLIHLSLPSLPLRVRYGPDEVGLHLYPSGVGSGLGLQFELRFPLIMKEVGAAADALAILVPLLDQEVPSALAYRFDVAMAPGWDADQFPALVHTNSGWRLSSEFTEAMANVGAKPLFGDLAMGGLDLSISDLVGDVLGGVSFRLRRPTSKRRLSAQVSGSVLTLPVGFTVSMGGQPLEFTMRLQIDLVRMRLANNRLHFTLPRGLHGGPAQVIDLHVLALLLPNRDPASDSDASDGYLDLDTGEFALVGAADQAGPQMLFPGNLTPDGLERRLLFALDRDFDADNWPGQSSSPTARKTYFRVSRDGVSFRAKVETAHETTVLGNISGMSDVKVRPQQEKGGLSSEFVVVDNVIRAGAIFCEMDVPGTDDLTAELEVGLRQNQRGVPPVVYAALTTANEKPLAQLSAGYLQVRVDNIRGWKLSWDTGRNDWDLTLPTDGALSLSPRTPSAGGIEDLRKHDVIRFRGLDLVNLHQGAAEIELPLEDFVEFKLLDGMFQVRLTQLRFGWGDTFFLTCEQADFQFQQSGSLDVTITAGNLRLDFLGGTRVKLQNPSRLGIDVIVADAVRYRGAVAWVDNDRERYFAAAGTLSITGLPEASTLLKLGVGRKENGQLVPNVVFYGSIEKEVQLYSGVVAKSFGAGIGINNRLAAIGERPNAETVLARIDDLNPARIEGWEFVSRNGFFLSIVGTTEIASNTGSPDTINAYVASLILSIDVDLNVVAAGKLWLSSSLQYVRNPSNANRPALVGAIVISPRQQLISAALESRQNPAIESNPQLAAILKKGKIRFSFLMSPKIVDFFLQEVSYRDEFLGIQMLYQGSMRLAIFRGTILYRASHQITGSFHKRLEAGPGGFEARGDLSVLVEYGGLLSRSGLAAYGLIDFSLSLQVRAWITIGFSFTIGWGRWKKRISFSKTFSLGETRLELGLRGAIAFDESGDFGFDGTLSISVSICGYQLSISPALKFNEQVIPRVRGRVAAFERRLEEYRRELLGGSGADSAASASTFSLTTVSGERWLWYQMGDWHMLLPKSDEVWLAPGASPGATGPDGQVSIQFDNDVVLLEVFDENDDLVATIEPPWHRAGWANDPTPPSSEREAQLEEAETILAETSGPPAASNEDYQFHTDPRVESLAREYWSETELSRPDYAPPLAMRSPETILQSRELSDSFDRDYQRLIDYLFWRTRSLRHQLHRESDTDDHEDALHNRGALAMLLVDELRFASSDPNHQSAWRAQEKTTSAPALQHWFGWVFRLDSAAADQLQNYSFRVTRRGSAAQPISVEQPLSRLNEARRSAKPLPARQAFVVDQPGDDRGDGERGRVIVKLPVAFDAKLFGTLAPTVSHYQVWRRLPGEVAPKLVGDLLRPDAVRVDEALDGQLDERATVVGPYLFTDEFRTSDRLLNQSGLDAESAGIEYRLKLIPVGDDSPPSHQGSVPWDRVRLYVPPQTNFPDKPGMLVAAQTLFDDQPAFAFSLASMGTEATQPATILRNGKPQLLTTADFQLFIDEGIDTIGKGFYVGGEEISDGSDASTSPVLDDVGKAASASLDTLDKQELPVAPVPNRPGWFQVAAADLQAAGILPGRSYRFYIREQRPSFLGSLAEIQPLVVKTPPQVAASQSGDEIQWQEAPRFRAVDDVEWIPATDRQQVEQGVVEEVPVEAHLRALEPWNDLSSAIQLRGLRRRLGLSWSTDLSAGGIELTVRDTDDSALRRTVRCEHLSRKVFRRRVVDFSNPSRWQLTRHESVRRRTFQHQPAGVISASEVDPSYFLYTSENNSMLQRLVRRQSILARLLLEETSNWRDIFPAAKNWFTAVLDFEKSPLNLKDELLNERLLQIRALVEHMLTGRFDPTLRAASTLPQFNAEVRARMDEELDGHLLQIDRNVVDERQFGDDDEGRLAARRAYLDLRIARKLAAIIRRRRNLSRELFSGASDRVPETGDTLGDGWLLRSQRFESLRSEAVRHSAELGGQLPLTNQLLAWFPNQESTTVVASRTAQRLLESTTKLNSLASLDESDGDNGPRRQHAATVVSRAAGLTAMLQGIRGELDRQGWQMVSRPHHQVSTDIAADGSVQAVPISLQSFRSDEQQVGTADDELPAHEIVALGNLLERMGFGVDVALFDELQQLQSQDEVLRRLQSLSAEQLLGDIAQDHVLLVLAGREPDSEHRGDYPDPVDAERWQDFAGYSFVKLLSVPLKFFDLLSSNLAGENNPNVEELRGWFTTRELSLGEDSEWIPLAAQYGRVAAYLRFNASQSTNQLLHIRLESRDRRWSSVPEIQGKARVDWELPDRRGHSFAVAARRVSRYEPFIRWALGLTSAPSPQPNASRQDTVTVRRLIAGPDEEQPAWLPVSAYPHPDRIRFSYILPPAGSRGLLNAVSAVRTGYAGCRLAFHRQLADHDADDRRWNRVMSEAELLTTEVVDPLPVTRQTPRKPSTDVRLFRHERLVELEQLPYFYEYALHVRSQYDADALIAPADAVSASITARRSPGWIAMRRAQLTELSRSDLRRDYRLQLRLTRTGDLLSGPEFHSGPALEPVDLDVRQSGGGTTTVAVPPDRLPDLAFGYDLYLWANPPTTPNEPQTEPLFLSLLSVKLPWHSAFQPPASTEPLGAWAQVFDSRIEMPDSETRQRIQIGTNHAYIVEFEFALTRENTDEEFLFEDIDHLFLRAGREGKVSLPIRLEATS